MIPYLGITALLADYRSGTRTPRQVILEAWTRAEKADPAICISRPEWSVIDELLTKLETSDPAKLPLYGVPFAIKDNIDWAGQPTTCACPAFSYVAKKSAFVVEALIAAGAIPMGKTNLDQFATGLVGVRSPYGFPANPFNADYIPGGSSSGSAVAVALGLASFALGTDTAGSGRIPASLNNLVGLKPTKGLLSTSGLVPACRSLDCISIFALSAEDAMTVFDVAAVYDVADPYARKAEVKPGKPIKDTVVGIPAPEQLHFFGNAEAEALFHEAICRLESMGMKTKPVNLQPFLDAARLLYEGPWVAERYAGIEDLIKRNPEALHPVTLGIIGGGDKANAVAAFRAQYRLAALRRESEAAWDEVDIIMTPTGGTHFTRAEVMAEPVKRNSELGTYTNYMNLLDLAAWAVPTGFLKSSGMPWGVTFFAPAFTDAYLGYVSGAFHAAAKLPLGMTEVPVESVALVSENKTPPKDTKWMQIAVCGAHMEGLPLNHQILSRGGRFVTEAVSAPIYRLYHLPGKNGFPPRPGMVRVPEGESGGGAAIAMEIWELPEETVGSFLGGIGAPLGLGRVVLQNGSTVCGFMCEGLAASPEEDITSYGGWRAWLAR